MPTSVGCGFLPGSEGESSSDPICFLSSATPTMTPTSVPRVVVTQAQPFQNSHTRYGLPVPLIAWPVQQAVTITQAFRNGYGPNSFAYEPACRILPPTATPDPNATPGATPTRTPDPCQYASTHRIHTGIDYYTDPREVAVIALCDGVVIEGLNYMGGSAGTNAGSGVSLRCFANDPNDTNNDGLRNLSNVVLVYNHLNLINTTVANNIGRIVSANSIIGITTGYTTLAGIPVQAHLHLEVYMGYGFHTTERVILNPLLLYNSSLEDGHSNMSYPVGYDRWTLQGNLSSNFVSYWTSPNSGQFINDINTYINVFYLPNSIYRGPECSNLSASVTEFSADARCTLIGDDSYTGPVLVPTQSP